MYKNENTKDDLKQKSHMTLIVRLFVYELFKFLFFIYSFRWVNFGKKYLKKI